MFEIIVISILHNIVIYISMLQQKMWLGGKLRVSKMYGGRRCIQCITLQKPPKYIPAYVHRYYSVPIFANPQKLFCHHKLLVGCKHRASEGVFYIYAAADLYVKSLSRLRLHVARLYLHCGISHWTDI